MKKITIEISPTGEVSIEDDHGGASDVTQSLEQALGKVSGRKHLCATQPQSNQHKLRQSNG